jgi:hypothetical protein
VVRERAERHWWIKNAGFKLVAGKSVVNSFLGPKKLVAPEKVNW